MRLRPLHCLLAPVTLAAITLLPAGPAYACSQDPCPLGVEFFPEGMKIPGNLVYFKMSRGGPTELSLATQRGEPIAASIRTIGTDIVFAPDADIPAGTNVVLSFVPTCALEPSVGLEPVTFEFTTIEPREIELTEADLTIVESGETTEEGDLLRYVDLKFESPDANGALAHLTNFEATIDDITYWVTGVEGGPGVRVASRCTRAGKPYDMDATTSCGNIQEVKSGRHTVKLTARAVGIEQPIAVLEREVTTTCEDDFQVTENGLEAKKPSGGCTVGSETLTQAGPLLLSAWLLVLRRRRRLGSDG